MATIKLKREDGTIAEYTKPSHCPIPDEIWCSPLGYCWSFAYDIDEGKETCTEPTGEGCYII
jgi:hypothetical protein